MLRGWLFVLQWEVPLALERLWRVHTHPLPAWRPAAPQIATLATSAVYAVDWGFR